MVSHWNQEDPFISCEYMQNTTLTLVLFMLGWTQLLTTNDGARSYRNIYFTKDAGSTKRDFQRCIADSNGISCSRTPH